MNRSRDNTPAELNGKNQLDEATSPFELSFCQATIGIALTTLEGKFKRVNQKFCSMLGYTESELLGLATTDFSSQTEDNNIISHRQLILEGKIDTHTEEQRYRRKDGSYLWAKRTLSLIRDSSGAPLCFLRIIDDITDSKKARDLIARDTALLRTIIDAIPSHIYAKDKSGKFILANKAWLNARGDINPDISGKIVHDFFKPKLASILAAQDEKIIETGKSIPEFEHKLTVTPRAGQADEVRWGATTKVPLTTAAGEIIGTVGITNDITEAKRSDARRHMAQAVTHVLAQSQTLEEAMPEIIKIMCEAMGWQYGARWAPDGNTTLLIRTHYWCKFEPEFDSSDRDLWLKLNDTGTGRFLRRAWTDRAASWIGNLHDEQPFRRKASVLKLGWHSAFAFPIVVGNNVTGVLEFFGDNPCDPDEMLLRGTAAISSQIGQFIQRKEAEDKLAFLARFDIITGLPNRFLFTDRLTQVLTQAQRNKWAVGVLFVDLDRFKLVNDTLGHAAGDELLRQVAERMQNCIRSSDTVGRLSGDEFGVILSTLAKADDAAIVAQKIVDALATSFQIDGHQSYISASIGISLYPSDSEEAEALLKNADTAMYRAKELGRNGYQYFRPEMNQRLIHHQKLDAQLHVALEREEFLLHYQPKVSLETGAITGFEALLRWQHGDQLVPPGQFIPIMEDTGLIVPVGEWVLNSVCAQIKKWERDGLAPVPVAVNLSTRQFQRKNLSKLIGRLLQHNGIDPRLLKLELTESLLMNDAEESIATLHQLNSLGAHLSVDDFGTGYSSLAYLKRFPLNELKIDRAFIRDATSDPDDAAIAMTIINLAHSLKLSVVAEGVENQGQFDFLKLHECDEFQGYYFARPLPAADCTLMLRDNIRLPIITGKSTTTATRLLLVAVNPDEIKRLKQSFSPAGYHISTATNSGNAFEHLARYGADIVISDNDLPERSGVEFLTKVRELYPNILRVLTSSGDPPTVTRATNHAGIHLFLAKHWVSEQMCTEVRDALRNSQKNTDARRK